MSSVVPSSGVATAAPTQAFSFPILKLAEISQCLTELGVPLTVAQLKEPTEDEVRPVLEKLLEMLTGKARDELRQMDFRGMEILAYPELHDESLVAMGTLREMLDLCQKCGVFNITLTDFLSPERKRLSVIFSALINFAKFREDKMDFFAQFVVKSQQLLDQRVSEEAACEELEKQRSQLAEQHETLKPQMSAVQAEQETLAAELQTLVAKQTALREEMKTNKAASSELAAAISERNVEILGVQSENSKIKAQIVPEPEKLKQSLKDMTHSMHVNRQEISASASKLKVLQSRSATLTKVEEKLVKRVEFMKAIAAEQGAVAKLKKQIAEAISEEAALEASNTDLLTQESTLKENLTAAQEKLFALQKNFEAKRVTAQAALEQVTGEKESLERMLQSARNQQEQNENLMSLKKQQMSSMANEHTRTMTNLRTKFAGLQQAVNDYHEKLAMIMNQATMV